MKYLHERIPGRSCGACTACCTSAAVEELNKPMWTACEHICGQGCAIYDHRPASCHDFECLWLKGYFGLEQHRPDKCGLIFAMQKDRRLGAILVAWETAPNSASKEPGRYILERLSQRRYVYIFPYGEKIHRVVVGPKIEALRRAAMS